MSFVVSDSSYITSSSSNYQKRNPVATHVRRASNMEQKGDLRKQSIQQSGNAFDYTPKVNSKQRKNENPKVTEPQILKVTSDRRSAQSSSKYNKFLTGSSKARVQICKQQPILKTAIVPVLTLSRLGTNTRSSTPINSRLTQSTSKLKPFSSLHKITVTPTKNFNIQVNQANKTVCQVKRNMELLIQGRKPLNEIKTQEISIRQTVGNKLNQSIISGRPGSKRREDSRGKCVIDLNKAHNQSVHREILSNRQANQVVKRMQKENFVHGGQYRETTPTRTPTRTPSEVKKNFKHFTSLKLGSVERPQISPLCASQRILSKGSEERSVSATGRFVLLRSVKDLTVPLKPTLRTSQRSTERDDNKTDRSDFSHLVSQWCTDKTTVYGSGRTTKLSALHLSNHARQRSQSRSMLKKAADQVSSLTQTRKLLQGVLNQKTQSLTKKNSQNRPSLTIKISNDEQEDQKSNSIIEDAQSQKQRSDSSLSSHKEQNSYLKELLKEFAIEDLYKDIKNNV